MKFIAAEPRDAERLPVLNSLLPRQKNIALYEKRLGIQEWVVMMPKAARKPSVVHANNNND